MTLALLLLLGGGGGPLAMPVSPPAGPPPALAQVDVVEHLGRKVPLDTPLLDHDGRRTTLGAVLSGRRPVVLALVWYGCPMLCNLVLNGQLQAQKRLGWQLGVEYDAVALSFDPRETPADAAAKRRGYLEALGLPESAPVWPYLTGAEPAVRAVAEAVGFRYQYDAAVRQFAHPAVLVVLTPGGVVSRYLYGIEFPPRNLKLALLEASQGRTGSTFERLLLHCYRYDPASRRYGVYVFGFLRAGGLAVFLLVGAVLFRYWRRELRRERAA